MTSPALAPDVLQSTEDRLEAVAQLLPEIGRTLCDMQARDLDISTKSNARDLVTAAELASEKSLTDFIRSRFPEDAILSEESDAGHWRANVTSADYCWVIDPLDGTVNYSHGMPLFCISVGLTYKGDRVGGLVLAPALGDFFRAMRGRGATLNGRPIRVSEVTRLRDAMIVTGFPYDRENYIDTLMQGVEAMLMNAQGLRRTGTAAMDLCWVASGRFDGFYEHTLNPWDTCAGLVILDEAGGTVTEVSGQPFDLYTPTLAATNGRFQEELVQALNTKYR